MSVRKDESRNRWIATVECGEIRGKRKRKQKSFKTKKEAYRWEREMQSMAENIEMSKYDITFEALAKEFIRSKTERGLASGTIRKHQNAIRIVLGFPEFRKKAREIKMPEIEAVLTSLAKSYSKSYLLDIKGTVSAIMSYGIDQDYLIKNPCSRVSLPRNTQPGRDNIDSFTKEEVAVIESHRYDIPYGDVIYVMLNTGLRSQELCALDKDSLITKDGSPYLRIDKAMNRDGTKWYLGKPKTESSVRDIPISNEVKTIILKRIFQNPNQVFLPGRDEKYISYATFRSNYLTFFRRLNKISETKVRDLPPHCCRHTFSSRCEWSGISMTITKELLGHTALTMTHKYTHIMDKDKESAIQKII